MPSEEGGNHPICYCPAGTGRGGMTGGAVLGGALAATLVERWSPPPDDNLWMPMLSALVMAVIQWLIGGQAVLFPLWR